MIPYISGVPLIGRSEDVELCTKCRNIVQESDFFAHCTHEVVTVKLTGFQHGTGIECLSVGCEYNEMAMSVSQISDMLNAHAGRHCSDDNPDQVFHESMAALVGG